MFGVRREGQVTFKKIYIYSVHIYTKHPGSGEKSGAGSVSGLPPLPPRANLSRAHGLGQHRHCSWSLSSGEEGEVKNSITTHGEQRHGVGHHLAKKSLGEGNTSRWKIS